MWVKHVAQCLTLIRYVWKVSLHHLLPLLIVSTKSANFLKYHIIISFTDSNTYSSTHHPNTSVHTFLWPCLELCSLGPSAPTRIYLPGPRIKPRPWAGRTPASDLRLCPEHLPGFLSNFHSFKDPVWVPSAPHAPPPTFTAFSLISEST